MSDVNGREIKAFTTVYTVPVPWKKGGAIVRRRIRTVSLELDPNMASSDLIIQVLEGLPAQGANGEDISSFAFEEVLAKTAVHLAGAAAAIDEHLQTLGVGKSCLSMPIRTEGGLLTCDYRRNSPLSKNRVTKRTKVE
jgi:hypothetical protein